MPRKSANTMTASMSPSAIALTTLLGTSWTRKSTPVAPAAERRRRCGARAAEQLARAARATARRRAEHVDQRHADQHRDAGHHDGVGERLQADAAELAQVAQLGDAERQRRDDQRNDQHEEQAEEDRARSAR